MTIKELIEKLSAFDGDMNVVFRTTEEFEIDEYETDTISHDHDVEIYESDYVVSGAWEITNVAPYVVIKLND